MVILPVLILDNPFDLGFLINNRMQPICVPALPFLQIAFGRKLAPILQKNASYRTSKAEMDSEGPLISLPLLKE